MNLQSKEENTLEENINLFRHGIFKLSSGDILTFKVECDALTNEDYRALAHIVEDRIRYRVAIGVPSKNKKPSNAEKFANALNEYATGHTGDITLIVDDVLTTGKTLMEFTNKLKAKQQLQYRGLVMFARKPIPPSMRSWVHSIWNFWQ